MASQTCPSCMTLLRVHVPEDDLLIGLHPVRLPFHRYRQTQAICPGAGRVVKVVAEKACGRCGEGYVGEHVYDCLDGGAA